MRAHDAARYLEFHHLAHHRVVGLGRIVGFKFCCRNKHPVCTKGSKNTTNARVHSTRHDAQNGIQELWTGHHDASKNSTSAPASILGHDAPNKHYQSEDPAHAQLIIVEHAASTYSALLHLFRIFTWTDGICLDHARTEMLLCAK